MSDTDLELLARYTRHHAEDAFAEIVQRHLGLVYSVALRQVRSLQLAEEVAQATFIKLARHATQLAPDTVLVAWLYQVARRESIDVARREACRQTREQVATEMNAMNSTAADWAHIEPLLDEAMQELEETDRAAVLLRYFENKSLREVGEALGASENAAQKRVSRAVERLRELFAKQGVSVGANGLVVALSANAIQAAPVCLAATISTAATALSATTFAATATSTLTQTIAMTTLQKTLISAALVAAVSIAAYKTREAASLRETNQALQRQQGPLAEQIEKLQSQHAAAQARIAALANQAAPANTNPSEVLKLRGQVGVLRQEKAEIGRKSALSKVTADPEARKVMREQQKMGMKMIHADLVKQLKLSPEVEGQFDDVMADHVMENIDLITQSLRDKPDGTEIDRLFSVQDLALHDKLEALFGPDGLEEYRAYSKDLVGRLTAAQFEPSLTGDKEAKAEKKKQLLQAMQEETRSAIAHAGLPADYQALPMLNFRNIASEETGEQNLKLMDNVFQRVSDRAAAFLGSDELKKFQDFRKAAIENNRAMLLMNRKMMAPIAE